MKAKWIEPKFQKKRKSNYPPCSANREAVYWRDERGKIYKCTRPAIVTINKKNYCYQHGGAIALQHCVNESWKC